MTLKLLQDLNLDDMLENLDKRMPESLLMTNLLRMVKLQKLVEYKQYFRISIEEDKSEKDTDFVLIVRTDDKSYITFSVRDYEDEATREKVVKNIAVNVKVLCIWMLACVKRTWKMA